MIDTLKNLRIIVSICLFFLSSILVAQENANYTFDKLNGEITVVPEINRVQLAREDSINERKPMPYRLALLYPLKGNFFEQGKWIDLGNGKSVYKLVINAPLAYGIIVRFTDFYLPDGSQLIVYNPDNELDSWEYKPEYHPSGGRYSVETLTGGKIALEYVPSTISKENPRLQVDEIGYKYKPLNQSILPVSNRYKRLNDPNNKCMMNVNCDEGLLWKSQSGGIAQMRVPIGTNNLGGCSGTLINNTNMDTIPYFLTAYHCLYDVTNDEPLGDIEKTEFWFNFETEGCENEVLPPNHNLISGAQVLVANPMSKGSDGLLLLLKDETNQRLRWKLSYNGWSRENVARNITNGVIVHHPLFDVKKISFYSRSPASSTWGDDIKNVTSLPNVHWQISYSNGSTQGGSSGAPMFDQDGYIVGSLSGGASDCNNINLPDWYSKFWYNFDQSPNENYHMSKYLDPKGLNPQKLPGLAPAPIVINRELTASFVGDYLYITSRGTLKNISVVNLKGFVVYTQSSGLSDNIKRIDTSSWKPGVYVVTASSDRWNSRSTKVVKQQ